MAMVLRPQIRIPRWSHFLIPVIMTGSVVALRFSLTPILGDSGPFFLASLAVLVSAFIGGFWPGLLATFLTTIVGSIFFLKSPDGGFLTDSTTRVILGAQITICFCISLICGALRSSEIEAAANADREREARSKRDALFNSITDKLITVDRDLVIQGFNQAASERWNLMPDCLGKPFADVMPATLTEPLLPHFRQFYDVGSSEGIEVFDSASGRTYEVRSFPSPEGLLVYFHNITDRIRANEAIAQLALSSEHANALLDSLLTHAPLGFAFFDRDMRVEKVNEQLSQITGLTTEAHEGRHLKEIVPQLAAEIEPIIQEVFETGRAVDQIEISSAPFTDGGETRHWQTGFYPVSDADGNVKSVGTVVVEITQRKLVEDRLRQSEERFRNLADNAPMMVWLCELSGKAVWFNRSWLEFKAKELEPALELGCFDGIHPEDEPWVSEIQAEAFKNGESFTVEYRTQANGDEYRWIHVLGNPIRDEKGQTINYLISSIDITDRITMEENLRRSLANERAARSDAEAANRMKDEFLAGLSHELRTPLTTMLGWTELLMRPKVREEEIADGLQIIQRSSKLQLQLINDLLDMSRISVNKIVLELSYAELFDLVEAVTELLSQSAAEKNVRLRIQDPGEPIIVQIDPDRFTQIIWNLLSNAIKFTPAHGHVDISISKEDGMACVTITDQGIGIEKEFLPHVFDRFRQADAARSRRHGGLGLGLAIARHLAELHGGSIHVHSEGKNQGSTFVVRVPLGSSNVTELISPPRTTVKPEVETRRLVDVCVLIVEDDHASRDLLSKVLKLEGAIVIPADSAKTARRLLRETSPDLVISDIGLPDEDGYQFIRSIRSGGGNEFNSIPSIALTAFAGSDDRMKAFESGFNMFLTKPVEPEDLVRSVLELRLSQI